jgi:C-terminal processing protease CtpA/Prc
MNSPKFSEFAARVLKTIDTENVARVIIDLRENPGGNSDLIRPLLEGLRARPAINHKGGLFVLIDREVNSSAVDNAVELREQTNALIVGELSGGSPWHYGEVKTLTLPNSQLRIIYPTKFWKAGSINSPGVIPDISVSETADDYFGGRDRILETALRYQP